MPKERNPEDPRPESWPEEFILPVLGTDYQHRRGLLRLLLPKQAIHLRHEEDNPSDSNAIAIYAPERKNQEHFRIGYLPHSYAPIIRRLLDDGRVLNSSIYTVGTNDRGVWRCSVKIIYEATQDDLQQIRKIFDMMAVPNINVAGAIANAAENEQEIRAFLAQYEEGHFAS